MPSSKVVHHQRHQSSLIWYQRLSVVCGNSSGDCDNDRLTMNTSGVMSGLSRRELTPSLSTRYLRGLSSVISLGISLISYSSDNSDYYGTKLTASMASQHVRAQCQLSVLQRAQKYSSLVLNTYTFIAKKWRLLQKQEMRSVERGICPIAELHPLRLTLVS